MQYDRRNDDERIRAMFDKVNEIHESQKRVELALFGDTDINHIGIVNETKQHKKDIQDLKSFKRLIITLVSSLSIIISLLTNIFASFFK